jgi:hypothetical protein
VVGESFGELGWNCEAGTLRALLPYAAPNDGQEAEQAGSALGRQAC